MARRRILLLVAALLSASALLAVGILLFGHFGRTEGRILATTALLAAFGTAALPAAILHDRRRLPGLAAAVAALSVLGLALALTALWWTREAPEPVGKALGTVVVWLAAAAQTALLALRRSERDPPAVRRLFAASSVLAVLVAAALTVLVWTDGDGAWARLIGSAVVLDVLAVALQPILALARPEQVPLRLRVRLASGETRELAVAAPDRAAAAAKAIRAAECGGDRVVALELDERGGRDGVGPRGGRPG